MSEIIMYTGGQRCGKSELAEAETLRLATERGVRPVYLATAQVQPGDDEFAARVAAHQARRGPEWINVEEPLRPSRHLKAGDVALLDCMTLWCANAMMDADVKAYETIKEELALMAAMDVSIVAVTNEVGMGGVSPDACARRFADLQGSVNKLLATLSRKVILVVSGIAVTIKDNQ